MTTPIYELGDLVTIRKGKKAVEVSEGPSEGFLRYIQIEDLRNNDSMKYARNPRGPICDENDVLISCTIPYFTYWRLLRKLVENKGLLETIF